jgi:hypothetical protein
LTQAVTWMNIKNIMSSQGNHSQKSHVLHDSMYLIFSERGKNSDETQNSGCHRLWVEEGKNTKGNFHWKVVQNLWI